MKGRLEKRCPFCNINDVVMINQEDENFNKGFRYYCVACENYYQNPVVDLQELKIFLLLNTKFQKLRGGNIHQKPLRYIIYEDIFKELEDEI